MKLTSAVMKSPMGNAVPLTANEIQVKSGLPARRAMRGLIRSLTRAVTTPPNAAPITTPTARSTTLPRKINCLKPASITCTSASPEWLSSDSHRHNNIPVLIIFAFRGTKLTGRLRILQFEFHFARPGRFDEVHQVLSVESDRHRLAVIG